MRVFQGSLGYCRCDAMWNGRGWTLGDGQAKQAGVEATGAQFEQCWDDDNCDNCNVGLPR